jgi:hypothetical protein
MLARKGAGLVPAASENEAQKGFNFGEVGPSSQKQTSRSTYALYCGGNTRPLAVVAPDDLWPGLFRIHFDHGAISDCANLSRCRDSAVVLASTGPPRRNPDHLHWKSNPCERAKNPVFLRPPKKSDPEPSDGGAP